MRTDGPFHHVRVYLDAAIVEKCDEAGPVPYRIAHRLGEIGRAGDALDMFL